MRSGLTTSGSIRAALPTLRGWMALGLLSCAAAACFNPEDSAVGDTDTDASASTGTSSSTGAGSSSTASTTDPSDTGTSTTDDDTTTTADTTTTVGPATTDESLGSEDSTSSGDESSSSGDPVDPACDDGIVVATEVCYESALDLGGALYGFGFLEDLDGDGERDLIYSAASGEISVQLNSGGVFGLATSSTFAGVSTLSDLGFLNIDDDNVLDAFMVSISGAVVYTAFGATSGDFTLGDGQGSEAFAMKMGDLGGDARREAVVLSLAGVEVFGVADDGIISVLDTVSPENFGTGFAVELEDFNGDDQRDVLLLGQNFVEGQQVLMYLGNGDGTLNASVLGNFVEIDEPTDMTSGDFDGDDATDFALADGSNLVVVLGNDALGFTQLADITVDSGTTSVLVADDVDLDGADDLIIGYADRNAVTVYLADGEGDFAAPVDVSISHSVERISTGDANGDGVPDIVVTSGSANALTVLFSTN